MRAEQTVYEHLGLLPANDHPEAPCVVRSIADAVREQVDLDEMLRIAREASWPAARPGPEDEQPPEGSVRIGVARDAAFAFYYAEDLEGLRAAGAELHFFDTMADESLPDVDGLFIGGGFPERHMDALAANRPLRRELKSRIQAGMPVYAECGGLMYLSRSLRRGDSRAGMVGAIEADTVMHDKPRGRGYVQLRETGRSPWPLLDGDNKERIVNAHEFHYSDLENCAPGVDFAYEVVRGHGIDGKHDGLVTNNVLASFSHLRDVATHPWTRRFVTFVRNTHPRNDTRRSG